MFVNRCFVKTMMFNGEKSTIPGDEIKCFVKTIAEKIRKRRAKLDENGFNLLNKNNFLLIYSFRIRGFNAKRPFNSQWRRFVDRVGMPLARSYGRNRGEYSG